MLTDAIHWVGTDLHTFQLVVIALKLVTVSPGRDAVWLDGHETHINLESVIDLL